ncbi:MAG: hypothetical protein WA160_05085 [Pseudobdellovibrio sp.]
MKKTIIAALLICSQFAMAAGPKVERELSRAKAQEILASKEEKSKAKYIENIADLASRTGKVEGLSLKLKEALLKGDADLLMLVFKSIAKGDTASLKFIAEASRGVKSIAEASTLSKLTELENTGNFKAELADAIEKGSTLEEAMKIASTKIGKTGKDEITMEKIKDCII